MRNVLANKNPGKIRDITEAEVAAARAYRSVQRPKVAASPGTRLGESRAWVVLLRQLRFLRKTVCAQARLPCWHSFCSASPVTGTLGRATCEDRGWREVAIEEVVGMNKKKKTK